MTNHESRSRSQGDLRDTLSRATEWTLKQLEKAKSNPVMRRVGGAAVAGAIILAPFGCLNSLEDDSNSHDAEKYNSSAEIGDLTICEGAIFRDAPYNGDNPIDGPQDRVGENNGKAEIPGGETCITLEGVMVYEVGDPTGSNGTYYGIREADLELHGFKGFDPNPDNVVFINEQRASAVACKQPLNN